MLFDHIQTHYKVIFMKLKAKYFAELTAAEMYEILKSRAETFMLGQNIRCLDMDDVDYDCLHCFLFWYFPHFWFLPAH